MLIFMYSGAHWLHGRLDVRKARFYMTYSMNSIVFKSFDVNYEIDGLS